MKEGLGGVELVISVQQHFGIKISSSVAENLLTVGALHDFVVAELRRLRHPNIRPELVFEELRELIVEQLGVKRERVVSGASFFEDLDLDQR